MEKVPHYEIGDSSVSRLARQAGKLIRAIELAKTDEPVTFDVVFANQNLEETWDAWLQADDELYKRHAELFYEVPELATKKAYVKELDLPQIIKLTQDTLSMFRQQRAPWMSATLGLGIMQYAEAGRQIAHDPQLTVIQPETEISDASSAITERCGTLAQQAFEVFSGRIKGSLPEMPSVRLEYLGQLLNIHYAFWTTPAALDALDAKQRKVVEDALVAFQAKVARFDVHSMAGRPPQDVIRRAYVQRMQKFYDSYDYPPAGLEANNNVADAAPFVFGVLDAAWDRGYSAHESLQHAVTYSAAVGHLITRRARLPDDASQVFTFSGSWEEPELYAHFPDFAYDKNLSDTTIAKLNRRDQNAGTCPARWDVPIFKGGETHRNVLQFAAAVEECIGVPPPLLGDYEDNSLYVNPSALLVNYLLLSVANNGFVKA